MLTRMTEFETNSLPDPTLHPGYYAGVSIKRLAAWTVDTIICVVIAAIIASLPLFIGWFFFPLIVGVVNLIYRVVTITRKSSTWGMRFFNIELRNRQAERLDSTEALIHTIAFLVSSFFVMPQLFSALLMVLTDRGQGLHDMLTGTTAINKPSSH